MTLLAGHRHRPVEPGLVGQHAELLRVGDVPVHRSSLEQFLRRDATDVEARTADLVVLDHRDVETGGCAVQSGGVTTRTATDDHDVMVLFGHCCRL